MQQTRRTIPPPPPGMKGFAKLLLYLPTNLRLYVCGQELGIIECYGSPFFHIPLYTAGGSAVVYYGVGRFLFSFFWPPTLLRKRKKRGGKIEEGDLKKGERVTQTQSEHLPRTMVDEVGSFFHLTYLSGWPYGCVVLISCACMRVCVCAYDLPRYLTYIPR
ncbi:hypothetical protein F4775DRAFT_289746 [Biscogniauxia sp. FL1348]|nr:hypothetical protein F4775DRAFT_289746 [Biscogniauxia sp. FL1348]